MNENLKKAYYIVLGILILVFFTKDIDIKKFYEDIKSIENPNDLLVLVNKNNKLNSNYIPSDLELISVNFANENKYLRKDAKEAFERLSNDAFNEGYSIIAVSAYRSYEYQDELFNYYVKEKGLEYALNCSAKAGHSEHQTGLALDVMGANNDYDLFVETKEFEWMVNNAYKYGFILRYPKGKESITGFKYEPWHYRYVGDIAKFIYENNLTLEEYLEEL